MRQAAVAAKGGIGMTGIERIAAERKRQIEKEGWTLEHDDFHDNGQLATAGACYAISDYLRGREITFVTPLGKNTLSLENALWPWAWEWWKPTPENRIRELEKAGALIAAEIDRLLRLEAQNG